MVETLKGTSEMTENSDQIPSQNRLMIIDLKKKIKPTARIQAM